MHPTSLIFSHRADEHLPGVLQAMPMEDRPLVVDIKDLCQNFVGSIFPEETPHLFLRTGGGEIVSFEALKSIWWRRPTAFSVRDRLPAHLKNYVRNELEYFLDGLLACLPSYIRQYNNPHAQRVIDSKMHQLHLASICGFKIPKTCVTSDPHTARSFSQVHPKLIYKSFWGTEEFWQPTRFLTLDLMGKLDHVQACPVILQEYIEGIDDLRVIAIDDQFFAARFDLKNSRYPADVRIDTKITCTACDIPDDLKQKMLTFMSRGGIRYGAFDFRMTADGAFYFFEVNPAGQFLYLDYKAGTSISTAMAEALCRPVDPVAREIPKIAENDREPFIVDDLAPFASLGESVTHMT